MYFFICFSPRISSILFLFQTMELKINCNFTWPASVVFYGKCRFEVDQLLNPYYWPWEYQLRRHSQPEQLQAFLRRQILLLSCVNLLEVALLHHYPRLRNLWVTNARYVPYQRVASYLQYSPAELLFFKNINFQLAFIMMEGNFIFTSFTQIEMFNQFHNGIDHSKRAMKAMRWWKHWAEMGRCWWQWKTPT